MLSNEITKDNIKELVASFYRRVRADKDLGPIFVAQLGDDSAVWAEHIAHITQFWTRMLLNEGEFNGQPMKTHMNLPPFPKERFDDWLRIWEVSLNAIYTPEIANGILQRAQEIAKHFKEVIYEGKQPCCAKEQQ